MGGLVGLARDAEEPLEVGEASGVLDPGDVTGPVEATARGDASDQVPPIARRRSTTQRAEPACARTRCQVLRRSSMAGPQNGSVSEAWFAKGAALGFV